jgi:DNA-binding LacI/PurR family transcriptional regulator
MPFLRAANSNASPRPARVKDVAALAGVSVTAVSRYLNAGLTLPPATAARIDAAVRKLDYRPNRMARSLSLGRTDTIGLVVPEIANPFFAHLAAAVEEAAEAEGMGCCSAPPSTGWTGSWITWSACEATRWMA